MIVCGIEITGSKAIFTVLKKENDGIIDITGNFRQLQLVDDENNDEIRSFAETVISHFDTINPDRIGIIKRNKTGRFSGGVLSFKVEGLIQLYPNKNVELVSPHTLRTFEKKNHIPINPQCKYQEESYLLALYLLEV